MIPRFFKEKRNYIFITILFLGTLLIYSSFLSNNYLFDSIDYAIIAETGYNLFWKNHLLQHLLQKSFYELWRVFGYTKGAIVPLQTLNAIFGAFGVSLFFVLVKKITKKSTVALITALSLAFSNAYWYHSREVEILIIPCVLLVTLFILLLKLKEDSSWSVFAFIGLIHGIEGLLYQSHLLFWPTVIVGVLLAKKTICERLKSLTYYLAFFFITIVIPYGLTVKFSIKSFINCFFSNAFSPLFSGFNSQTFSLTFRAAAWALFEFRRYPGLTFLLVLLLLFLLVYFVIYHKRIWNVHPRAIILSMTFILTYLPCQMWYAPGNSQYWIPSLIPFWIIIALIFKDLFLNQKNIMKFVPISFLVLLSSINFFGVILPTINPNNNYVLQKSYFIKDNTKEGDLIIFVGAGKSILDSMYIPYFARREPFSFYRFYTWHDHITVKYYDTDIFKALEKRINHKLDEGNSVYVYGEVLDVDAPYATYYNFRWPVDNKEMFVFLTSKYEISYYKRFKDEKIYEIKSKSF